MGDEELVKLILQGDDNALQRLYDRYFQVVFQYAFIQTGNYHDAEEVTQDVFSKMARYLHKYQQKSTFKTWLFTIGRNVIIDYHRKHKRQKSVRGFYEGEMEALATTNKESEWQNDNMEAILDILAKLPQDYRSVIQLRFIDGFSLNETAEIMKKTLLSVKSLQHRAKKQLQESFHEREGGVWNE
ncbi:RNA polymerase sigma factor [Alkalihalobacillus pseudalcaliphilus]|uniref:RNA polymerase sigma factor n=1 Tax=Alkalihalobacillus pseudalcaliphilus TaxID=79884 RepID=UPI00064DD948|nr:RNA polymerase sigma factor [Alkalihalobacillus pseudalcaliphilus]KMK75505.1 hypothetical protein AB990_09395 [Alkalihalobacillus pseudalcaliphilus]